MGKIVNGKRLNNFLSDVWEVKTKFELPTKCILSMHAIAADVSRQVLREQSHVEEEGTSINRVSGCRGESEDGL